MSKEIEQTLPLEFKQINIVKLDSNTSPENKKNIEVDFYQSHNISVENFYKPISKIVNIDFQRKKN